MRSIIACAPVLLVLCGLGWGQDLPLQLYSLVEGFEGDCPPLELWASNGSAPVIAFNGPTDEMAAQGRRSLKLDITLGDGSYYYLGRLLRIPCSGELKMSIRIRVGEGTTARVGFGVNMNFPPSRHSGCGAFTSTDGPTAGWLESTCDLVQRGADDSAMVMGQYTGTLTGKDVGAYLDRWSLFIYGSAGQRAVVYLDDLRVEGRVPSEADYDRWLQARWDAAIATFRQRVQDWRQRLDDAGESLAELDQAPAQASRLVALVRDRRQRAGDLLAEMDRDGYASQGQISELESALSTIHAGPAAVRVLAQAIEAGRPMLVNAAGNAVSRARAAGDPALLLPVEGNELVCKACRGETESLSAVVSALAGLTNLRVVASDLQGPVGTIPASAVDVRIVKWWYQGASGSIGYSPKKALLAELLLKDDALVRVDTETQDNLLRSTQPDGTIEYLVCSAPDSSGLAGVRPVDAATLQPVDLAAGTSREYWVNVTVPTHAASGEYMGTLTFACDQGSAELPLRLTVRPFDLAPSRLTYSIYYRGCLSPDGQPTIGSELKSDAQYFAEIADMKAHGVLYPTNYQGMGDDRVERVLELRAKVGLPRGRFYNLGTGVGPRATPEELEAMVGDLKAWMDLLAPYGYDEVYFYGTDEATGDALTAQKASWRAAQEAGARTFVACYRGTFDAMGSLLNCAVFAGAPDPEEARRWHSVGSEVFCYANPQVGVEDPPLYRRNFGLVLWKAGFDGAMDYAYQHGFGHVWNDFDDHTYRDHNFTYPTVNGVVGTIQWEGFREGVDDVRYVTTLERAIERALEAKGGLAEQAQAWLRNTDLASGDLDAAREQIADWVVKLQAE